MSNTHNEQIANLNDDGLYNLLLDQVVNRNVLSGPKNLIDFVNTNYLGFDFDPTIHTYGEAYAKKWGSISGWSRMELDPLPHRNIEKKISQFLGCDDVILSHTITITNFSLIPGIVGKGTIIADEIVHKVVWEACRLARDHGAKLTKFKHQNMKDLEIILKKLPFEETKLIAVDGVYSISTEIAPIKELQYLCEKYNAWLYVDDAHGFGVLGESPSEINPYGFNGNGVVNYAGGNYNRTFYVSSFGKAFGVQCAFATVPKDFKENTRSFCLQYLFSAPVSPYTLGQVEAVMELNKTVGESARFKIRELVSQLTRSLSDRSITFENVFMQPVIYLPIGTFDEMVIEAKKLISLGALPGFRVYPLVEKDKCGFRFAITALHDKEQIKLLITYLEQIKQRNYGPLVETMSAV